MAKNNKYIWIVVCALALLGVLFLIPGQNEAKNTAQNSLLSVASISHGHGLAVDVEDPSKLYIATHYGLLVLVDDKDLYQVGKSRDDYMGFSPHPTHSKIFFSSGHPSGGGNIGFQKSEDGGYTWGKVSNGVNGPVDFHAMAISPADPNLIYGFYRGALQRSLDQGKTWEIVNSNIQVISLTVDSKDSNIVYATTPNGIMISRNKGINWTSLSTELEGGHVSVIAVHSADSKILLTFSEKLNGLGKSIDGGETWKKIDEDFGGVVIYYVAFGKTDPNTVYALTQENKIFKSINAGDTWIKIK